MVEIMVMPPCKVGGEFRTLGGPVKKLLLQRRRLVDRLDRFDAHGGSVRQRYGAVENNYSILDMTGN